jgi:hypothetical protein
MPNGMVWNMVYDRNAAPGNMPMATPEQLWQRPKDFLEAIIPVTEEAVVITAAHPMIRPWSPCAASPGSFINHNFTSSSSIQSTAPTTAWSSASAVWRP